MAQTIKIGSDAVVKQTLADYQATFLRHLPDVKADVYTAFDPTTKDKIYLIVRLESASPKPSWRVMKSATCNCG